MKHFLIYFLSLTAAAFIASADTTQGEQEKIYDFDELGRNPTPLSELEPDYPYGLEKLGKEGRVVLSIKVDEDGNVFAPTIIESSRDSFLKSSLYAIYEWKFSPGMKGEEVVKSRAKVIVEFNGKDSLATLSEAEPYPDPLSDQMREAHLAGLSQKPEPIKRVQPVYPKKQKRQRTNGQASIAFTVNEEGKPQRFTVVGFSSFEFVMPALEAAKQWEFKPARMEGVPVKTRVRIPFSFKLRL